MLGLVIMAGTTDVDLARRSFDTTSGLLIDRVLGLLILTGTGVSRGPPKRAHSSKSKDRSLPSDGKSHMVLPSS